MRRPYFLGLTGSIAMGKSTTAAFFSAQGVPVWDADATVHSLYGKGGGAVGAIAALHPSAVRDGAVDRAALRAWIARDPGALAQIEAVVHPLVAADRTDFIAAHGDADLLVFDIPLLFETGAQAWLDGVVTVTVPAEVQRRRLAERGTMTAAEIETILAKQMPDDEKRAQADWVIETNDFGAAEAAVAEVIAEIRSRRDA